MKRLFAYLALWFARQAGLSECVLIPDDQWLRITEKLAVAHGVTSGNFDDLRAYAFSCSQLSSDLAAMRTGEVRL